MKYGGVCSSRTNRYGAGWWRGSTRRYDGHHKRTESKQEIHDVECHVSQRSEVEWMFVEKSRSHEVRN